MKINFQHYPLIKFSRIIALHLYLFSFAENYPQRLKKIKSVFNDLILRNQDEIQSIKN